MLIQLGILAVSLATTVARPGPAPIATYLRRAGVDLPPNYNVPKECTDVCAPFINALGTCANSGPNCLCNHPLEVATYACVECEIQVDGESAESATLKSGQALMDLLVKDCASFMITLPPMTVTSFTDFPSASTAIPKTTSSSSSSSDNPNVVITSFTVGPSSTTATSASSASTTTPAVAKSKGTRTAGSFGPWMALSGVVAVLVLAQ